ncbi:MAG: hypothetical protein HUU18_06995 [Phycisphaerales bacterium]|nr:hypothetical protein [Phycisphaerales bacterium]
MSSSLHRVSFSIASILAAGAMAQSLVPASIVVQAGDIPAGQAGTIGNLNPPFTDADGRVGFTGSLTGAVTTNFVWYDTGIVWTNAMAPGGFVLSGAETSCGVGAGGQFLYSPSINGNDGIWGNHGYVIADGDPAPGAPGLFISFASRPIMSGNGIGTFIAGLSTTPGGSSQGRAVYRYDNQPNPSVQLVFRTGDVVFPAPHNFPINTATPTVSFTYDFSDNGLHHIHFIGLVTGAAFNDGYIYLDGTPLMREGDLTGLPGETWENFTAVGVNNSGQSVVCGDTNASAFFDGFVACNGQIAVREDDLIRGVHLLGPSTPQSVSINNCGLVVHVWTVGSGSSAVRHVFVGDVNNLLHSSERVVSVGDLLDTNADSIADYQVKAINATTIASQGVDLADDGGLYLELVISTPGQSDDREAIVRFSVPACVPACAPCVADFNNSGGTPDDADVAAYFEAWNNGDVCADANASGGTPDDADVAEFFMLWNNGGC